MKKGLRMGRYDLPYDFDLLWDVKDTEDVEMIANGEPHCSDARPEDLVELFIKCEMEVPECLSSVTQTKEIWICKDGTWQDYEPLPDEADKYRKARIHHF